MTPDYLPGLDRLDIRRLDHQVTRRDVVNSAIGFVLGTVAMTPAPLMRAAGEALMGPIFGLIAEALYKIGVVYVAIVILGNWTTAEDSSAD